MFSENWDFASVASLARNSFEAYLLFCYFSEPANGDEWRARLNIMQLCDCKSRVKLFQQLGSTEQAQAFEPHATDLRLRLEKNSYFQSLDPKLQKQLLQGVRPTIYTLRELSARAEVAERVWGYFELLSSHTHTLPLGFYRTEEQGRTGVANETDQSYIASAMEFAIDLLQRAIDTYKGDFTDLVSFSPTTSPVQELLRKRRKSVPLEQMNRAQRRVIEKRR